jgi:hypothetical protein
MEDQMPHRFAFVTGGQFGKPKAEDRKVIRSHCMRGKNKREVVEQPDVQWLSHDGTLAPSARPLLLSFHMHGDEMVPNGQRSQAKNKRRVRTSQQLNAEKAQGNTVPCPIPSPPLVRFADELDPESVKLLVTGW